MKPYLLFVKVFVANSNQKGNTSTNIYYGPSKLIFVKKFRSEFLKKIWFFVILCYGKHRNRFWGHSPCESTGHCASDNVGPPDGGNFFYLGCSFLPGSTL